jgi:hypothetical protein
VQVVLKAIVRKPLFEVACRAKRDIGVLNFSHGYFLLLLFTFLSIYDRATFDSREDTVCVPWRPNRKLGNWLTTAPASLTPRFGDGFAQRGMAAARVRNRVTPSAHTRLKYYQAQHGS